MKNIQNIVEFKCRLQPIQNNSNLPSNAMFTLPLGMCIQAATLSEKSVKTHVYAGTRLLHSKLLHKHVATKVSTTVFDLFVQDARPLNAC